MSLFGKIFGQKEPETIETDLELLPNFLEKNFSARKRELEMEVAKRMSEIKFLHSKSKDILENISKKSLEEKQNDRFNRAALTSKTQLEGNLSRILARVDPATRANTIEDAKAYAGESFVFLFNEINSFRKNIIYTSAYLKEDMKSLGEVLQDYLNKLQEMQKMLEQEKELFGYEKTLKRMEKISLLEKEKRNNEKEIEENNKQLSRLDDQFKQIEKSLFELENSPELKNVRLLEETRAELASKKQRLKTEIASLMATIDRPLQRFNALVGSGRWKISKEQQNLVEGILANPLLALKSDPKGEEFKKILKEVLSAIEAGKIELKDKEKEKRIDALNEMLVFDFFGNVFWKLNEIKKEQEEIEKALAKEPYQKKVEEVRAHENELLKEAETKKNETLSIQKNIQKTNEEIELERNEIISFAQKLLKKKIILK